MSLEALFRETHNSPNIRNDAIKPLSIDLVSIFDDIAELTEAENDIDSLLS